MLILNSKDGAFSNSFIRNLRFDHASKDFLLRLPARILDILVYFGFYRLACCMRTEPELKPLSFKRCMESDCGRIATEDGFVRNDSTSADVLRLKQDSVKVGSRLVATGKAQQL